MGTLGIYSECRRVRCLHRRASLSRKDGGFHRSIELESTRSVRPGVSVDSVHNATTGVSRTNLAASETGSSSITRIDRRAVRYRGPFQPIDGVGDSPCERSGDLLGFSDYHSTRMARTSTVA